VVDEEDGMGDNEDFGFALPAFQPEAALQTLRRELRALGLTERAGRFERRGLPMARAAVDGAVLQAARVERPSRSSPVWRDKALKNSADVRSFVADLKQQLAQWGGDDD
jgi:hypothetical protein